MRRYVVLYDGFCLLCSRAEYFIALLDWFHRIERVDLYNDAQIASLGIAAPSLPDLVREIHLIDRHGKTYTGFYACRKIGLLLPLLFPFALLLYIPGAPSIGERVYHYISTHRR